MSHCWYGFGQGELKDGLNTDFGYAKLPAPYQVSDVWKHADNTIQGSVGKGLWGSTETLEDHVDIKIDECLDKCNNNDECSGATFNPKKDNGLSACWLRKGRGQLENGLYSDFGYKKQKVCDRKVTAERVQQSNGWGLDLKFKCGDTEVNIGSSSGNNSKTSSASYSLSENSCPTRVDKSNWSNSEQYGDWFDITVSDCLQKSENPVVPDCNPCNIAKSEFTGGGQWTGMGSGGYRTNSFTIPNFTSKIFLGYEFKITDQGWGGTTRGHLMLMNITKDTEHYIKSGSGRGSIVYKDKKDITEFVSPGDEVKLKFKTGRWNGGHSLDWNYWKDIHLEFD